MGAVRELRDVALSDLTTFGLGGPAARLLEVDVAADLVQAVKDVDASGEALLVLGGGSNLVVADAGFAGTVVAVRTRGFVVDDSDRDVAEVEIAAGEPWDEAVARCVAEGLAGVECLSGIPGLVGATPMQNVGAYGQDVSQTVVRVRVLDRETGRERDLDRDACAFGYRTSALKGSSRYVVLSVRLRLRRSSVASGLRYAELERALGASEAPLATVRDTVIALRRAKGMVVDGADADTRSAGSFFVNPVLDAEAHAALLARAESVTPGAPPPSFPEADGRVKVSAGWLIERSGFAKGYARGGCAVSTKHALALTNRGQGTTADLVELAREIRAGVRATFGVELVPEPVLVGVAL
jgi:UDP-N-acetylmuramate dehydrogenase